MVESLLKFFLLIKVLVKVLFSLLIVRKKKTFDFIYKILLTLQELIQKLFFL